MLTTQATRLSCIAALVLALAACGDKGASNTQGGASGATNTAAAGNAGSTLDKIKSSSLLAQIGLVPTSTINTTAEFIFNRNIKAMEQENLSCRTIIVVGNGARGGY